MLYNFIELLIEIIVLGCITCGIFNYRFRKSIPGILIIAVYIATIIACAIIESDITACGIFETEFVFCNDFAPVSVISVLAVGLSISGTYRIFVTLLSYVAFQGIEEFAEILVKNIGNFSEGATEKPDFYLPIQIVLVVIFVAASVVLQKFVYKKHFMSNSLLNRSNIVYFILFTIGIFATFFCITPLYKGFISASETPAVLALGLVGIMTINVLLSGFFLYYNAVQKKQYKNMSEVNERLVAAQTSYYNLMAEKEADTRKFRHDYTNHLFCLSELIKSGKSSDAIEYIDTLIEKNKSLRPPVQSGNYLVNAIASNLFSSYPDVCIEWNGSLPEQMKLSNVDVCTVFFNLLQNAFLAASQCEDRKNVSVTVKTTGTSLFITIVNDKCNPIIEESGNFRSTKADSSSHGLGIANVKACVEKYNGTFEASYDDKSFSVSIVLP